MEPNRFGDIAAFVAAVKAGSFTAAADSLSLTRSAIGKSIVRLEGRLGVRLLNRTTRKLSLTDEGLVVYERWRQILEDLEEVDATMALRRGRPTGTLKLTAPLSFGQRHILPVLDAYLKQWPELRADISFTDRFVDLIEEGFDIAIRIGIPKDDSQILTRTIAEQQFLTCASPEYLARRGVPQVPQDLAGHDTIVFQSAERPRPWRFDTPEGHYLFDGPGRLSIDSSEAMREAALAGFGLVCLPSYLTGADVRAGTLVEVLGAYRTTPDPIRVVYPSKRHLSPRIRAFIDLLVARWEAGVPWEPGTQANT
ncbi:MULTISPECIES: LysR family transcriptional regulator [Cupriavidus]|uniref:LysR family transcriptional regulator n=1 Tax=Cupriavidus basilensis TaxID=68895 RepID=A0A643G4E8_9BURK|nr:MULTISPECIES: LysR family transcriptional regulator [Cupriavidus]KUE88020.1 LysR family transcriptional regulator [Cupriavidus necator]NOV23796.1 LysR family transcriptional regulator [Cupriavidus necator]QOT81845.1 LysR family transcriptional regulator [Cupriavidus basilensis]BDB30296.1 LysR family transcriptional regulator [Cupriavidus sp. P-10]